MFSSLEGTKKSAMSGFVQAKRLAQKKQLFAKRSFLGGVFPRTCAGVAFFLCLVVKHGHYRKKKV